MARVVVVVVVAIIVNVVVDGCLSGPGGGGVAVVFVGWLGLLDPDGRLHHIYGVHHLSHHLALGSNHVGQCRHSELQVVTSSLMWLRVIALYLCMT